MKKTVLCTMIFIFTFMSGTYAFTPLVSTDCSVSMEDGKEVLECSHRFVDIPVIVNSIVEKWANKLIKKKGHASFIIQTNKIIDKINGMMQQGLSKKTQLILEVIRFSLEYQLAYNKNKVDVKITKMKGFVNDNGTLKKSDTFNEESGIGVHIRIQNSEDETVIVSPSFAVADQKGDILYTAPLSEIYNETACKRLAGNQFYYYIVEPHKTCVVQESFALRMLNDMSVGQRILTVEVEVIDAEDINLTNNSKSSYITIIDQKIAKDGNNLTQILNQLFGN